MCDTKSARISRQTLGKTYCNARSVNIMNQHLSLKALYHLSIWVVNPEEGDLCCQRIKWATSLDTGYTLKYFPRTHNATINSSFMILCRAVRTFSDLVATMGVSTFLGRKMLGLTFLYVYMLPSMCIFPSKFLSSHCVTCVSMTALLEILFSWGT